MYSAQHLLQKLIKEQQMQVVAIVNSRKDFGKLINRINQIDGIVSVETSLAVRFLRNNWRFGIPGN